MKSIITLVSCLLISLSASSEVLHSCEIVDGGVTYPLDQAPGTNFAKFIGRDIVIHISFGDKPMSTWIETLDGVEIEYTSIEVLRPDGTFLYHGVQSKYDISIKCVRQP